MPKSRQRQIARSRTVCFTPVQSYLVYRAYRCARICACILKLVNRGRALTLCTGDAREASARGRSLAILQGVSVQ